MQLITNLGASELTLGNQVSNLARAKKAGQTTFPLLLLILLLKKYRKKSVLSEV